MRWRRRTIPEWSKWRRWFAWYPVAVSADGTFVWLTWVERRFDVTLVYYRLPGSAAHAARHHGYLTSLDDDS